MELGIRSVTTTSTLKNLILSCAKSKIPLLIHGKPGIGKSYTVRDVVTNTMKINFLDMRFSQLPPEDISGLPVPIKVGDRQYATIRSLPDFLPKEGKGCLFMDEINQASPAVLNALFQLILDRELLGGSYKLPDGWFIIAACNDFEFNKNVTEFEPPLNDRFLHVNFNPKSEEWLKWAKDHNISQLICDFISANADCLYGSDSMITENVVFPSARSWERVNIFEKQFENKEIDLNTLSWLVAGLVGQTTAEEYFKFTNIYREDPEGAKKLPKEKDPLIAQFWDPESKNEGDYFNLEKWYNQAKDYYKRDLEILNKLIEKAKDLELTDPIIINYKKSAFDIRRYIFLPTLLKEFMNLKAEMVVRFFQKLWGSDKDKFMKVISKMLPSFAEDIFEYYPELKSVFKLENLDIASNLSIGSVVNISNGNSLTSVDVNTDLCTKTDSN
jgi:hypothetical protein